MMHFLFNLFFRLRRKIWFHISLWLLAQDKIKSKSSFLRTDHSPVELDLVTVAFNNLEVVRLQHQLLQQKIQDSFWHLVADNSNNPQESRNIEDFCLENKISYVRIPKNDIWMTSASHSHGAAMNWVCRNILADRKSRYFGFIDHDIFPLEVQNLVHNFREQSLYGLLQVRGDQWYLWAGFCFFQRVHFPPAGLNFLPCNTLDTGGSNFLKHFIKIDKQPLVFAGQRYEKVMEAPEFHDSQVEWIDGWMHTFTGSNWRKSPISTKKWELIKNQLLIKDS